MGQNTSFYGGDYDSKNLVRSQAFYRAFRGKISRQANYYLNRFTFACMEPKESAFLKSLPDRRLSESRQLFLLSELIDKTSQEDLRRFARHLKPYLPLLAKIKSTPQPPKETPEA